MVGPCWNQSYFESCHPQPFFPSLYSGLKKVVLMGNNNNKKKNPTKATSSLMSLCIISLASSPCSCVSQFCNSTSRRHFRMANWKISPLDNKKKNKSKEMNLRCFATKDWDWTRSVVWNCTARTLNRQTY